jgi:hypothetical protein
MTTTDTITADTTGNILSIITPQQALLVVALLTALSVAAAALNYRSNKDAAHAGVFFAHVQVWQMSTVMNMLFWYILGSSTDAISAAVLPALFFCADLAKVIVPRMADYPHSWGDTCRGEFPAAVEHRGNHWLWLTVRPTKCQQHLGQPACPTTNPSQHQGR